MHNVQWQLKKSFLELTVKKLYGNTALCKKLCKQYLINLVKVKIKGINLI